jgi:hypothetical protein
MTEIERVVTIISLIVLAIFYAFTFVVFLVARKSRLNYALGIQKLAWLVLVVFVAIPAYTAMPYLPSPFRVAIWAALAVLSIWVMYEVYRANWHGGLRRFLRLVYCKVTGLCKVDSKPWV